MVVLCLTLCETAKLISTLLWLLNQRFQLDCSCMKSSIAFSRKMSFGTSFSTQCFLQKMLKGECFWGYEEKVNASFSLVIRIPEWVFSLPWSLQPNLNLELSLLMPCPYLLGSPLPFLGTVAWLQTASACDFVRGLSLGCPWTSGQKYLEIISLCLLNKG